MGFRYRKSINLGGGFRINLSKTGIGYSWGFPGYRRTRTANGKTRRTYSLPGTGLSYVDESGRSSRKGSKSTDASSSANNPLHNIESADIEQFKSAEADNITTSIEKTLNWNRWSNILLGCALLAVVQPFFIFLPIIGLFLKIMARRTGVVELDYSLDDEKADEYKKRISAWRVLAECEKEWQVVQEASISKTKVNAGAGRNVKRVGCKIENGTPFYLRTNVEAIQIKLQNEALIFLPDKVLIVRNNKVGTIEYNEVSIRTSQIRFIETGPVPKDAKVVGSTWQYVNNNGTPDRRYRNNRQLPKCLYGVVLMTSPSGLNVEMHLSNAQKTIDFETLIR